MHTANLSNEKYEALKKLFPNAITEAILGHDENGEAIVERSIDADVLTQEINTHVVLGKEERYQFTWPDKKKSVLMANAPIAATLRPSREESVDFDKTENLYIEGDNLDVLKLLQEPYLHSIDVIYIDPPYNTGNNLIYQNDFHQSAEDYLKNSGQYDDEGNRLINNPLTNGRFHTDWLNMIYPRLKIAKNLLSKQGVIVMTIDDYEIENAIKIMNEIFGESNHLATIVIKNNPSGRSTVSGAAIAHEYALFYGSNQDVKLGRLPRNEKQISRYKESDELGQFEWVNFRKHGGYKEDAPKMYYPIYVKTDCSGFRIPKLRWNEIKKAYDILELPEEDEITSLPIDDSGRQRRWKWSLERALSDTSDMKVRLDKDKKPAVYIKSRMKDDGMLPLTVWDDKKYSSTEYGTNLLIDLLGNRVFDYPKSLYAVMDCIRVASNKKDAVILDFFSGSSTTAHAVMKLNSEDNGSRKFIMVQVPEEIMDNSIAKKNAYTSICDIAEERIKCAGEKIKSEVGLPEDQLDFGFRVFKLDSSNMKEVYYTPEDYAQMGFNLEDFMDNIKPDRSDEDLLFQVMLDLGIPLSAKIEQDEKTFNVNENYLIACFDRVDTSMITEIAQKQPYYAIFRDSSFMNDSALVNVEQIFNTYSPSTIRRVL